MHQSFRPGDLIRCQILSVNDAGVYHVSTAKPDLGVIMARSEVGETMLPLSWKDMLCPKTLQKEPRKCARPW